MRFIVELLLSEWTPQDVADIGPQLRQVLTDGNGIPVTQTGHAYWPSIATIQRIAKEWGCAKPIGGARVGAGRRKGTSKPPEAARAAHALRVAGFGFQDIAEALGLRSRQHAMALCKRFIVGA